MKVAASSWWLLLCVSVVWMHYGCAGRPGPPSRVRQRAAADMNCPLARLKYTKLGNQAYRISGCRQHATYVHACPAGRCQWMLDQPPQPTH